MNKGMLVILSAPSGCGKDTVYNELCKIRNDIVKSVSATTRPKREGEVEGVNYYYITNKEFEDLIENSGLIEYTSYNNFYYGTPVSNVTNAINDGKICFLIIEVEGAQNIMKLFPDDSVSIFLLPPSFEVLEERLRGRDSDDEEIIQGRLKIAEDELSYKDKYDYNVVNDELDACVNEINEIISAELNKRNA